MLLNIDAYLLMGIAWAIIGTIDLLRSKTIESRNTKAALVVLVILSLNMFDHIMKPRDMFSWYHYITHNAYLLIGPVMYIYVLTLLNQKYPNKLVMTLLVLPFIVYIVIMNIYTDAFLMGLPRRNPGRVPGFAKFRLSTSRVYLATIQNIIYYIIIQVKLHNHNSKILDFYSYKSFYNTLIWLRILLLIAIPFYTILIISMFMPHFGFKEFIFRAPAKFNIIHIFFTFFFVIFSRDQRIPEDVKDDDVKESPEKYKKSSVDPSHMISIYKKLKAVVEDKKLYLNPDLNLEDLSAELGITKHTVSQVLNTEAKMNFYMFINTYRVEEFKLAIQENRYPNFSIIGIAMECGFRSQSTFYSIFKKFEDMTPSSYVKTQNIAS